MDKENFFKIVQQYTKDVPLLLVGTGGTIPYGIPGMKELSEHLVTSLNGKYKSDEMWDKFVSKINNGIDLESALTDINLKSEILNDIIAQTWMLVNSADIALLNNILTYKTIMPLSKLIKKFHIPNPQCVNIITTNYDRVIEYACDQFALPTDVRFNGNYFKSFNTADIKSKCVVNLIKVHGSLDLFKDKDDFVYSIPLQNNIPNGFIPEIITPGENKYRALLTSQCADLKRHADNLIDKANSFLCIGYGFNDNQIQRNIIQEIKRDKPIVLVTKQISDDAIKPIINNSNKYVIIQESADSNKTDVFINAERTQIDGIYWTIDGFLNII